MAYFQSSQIKVFPTTKRNDIYDRSARLPTEYNLTNIINRLTSRDSFIIDGLSILSNQLQTGSFNIHGYYFELKSPYNLSTFNPSENQLLCLNLTLKESNVSGSTFIEIISGDQNQSSQSSNSDYEGLTIEVITKEDNQEDPYTTLNSESNFVYHLPIARYISGAWQVIENNRLKYNSSDLAVNISEGLTQSNTGLQNLQYFLDNFIIDDGEI